MMLFKPLYSVTYALRIPAAEFAKAVEAAVPILPTLDRSASRWRRMIGPAPGFYRIMYAGCVEVVRVPTFLKSLASDVRWIGTMWSYGWELSLYEQDERSFLRVTLVRQRRYQWMRKAILAFFAFYVAFGVFVVTHTLVTEPVHVNLARVLLEIVKLIAVVGGAVALFWLPAWLLVHFEARALRPYDCEFTELLSRLGAVATP